MKDGVIVQIGTAEELVVNPATDYVRDFTRDVAKGKLLTVARVMAPPLNEASGGGANGGLTIKASESVAAVAARVIGHEGPVAVVDEAGRAVGSLSRDQVVDVLFAREA